MTITKRLNTISEEIYLAEKKYHRIPNSVLLLAVSKKQSIEKIHEAFSAGQKCFAENYLQEAMEKQKALSDLDIEWHFIGNIQSNKTKLIAENFNWVHSINKLSIATRLNAQRPAHLSPLNICIEVNIDGEKTKSGVMPQDIVELAKNISDLKNLKLRGLMVIPEKAISAARQTLSPFRKTFLLQQELIQRGFKLDTLSMGMSSDFEAAIAAGSTIIRIGTAIFGKR